MDLYLSPHGDGCGDGSPASPFACLEAARDAVRALARAGGLPAGGVTVWLRGGDYHLTRSFSLTPDDSGRQDAPINYRACPGETARLLGGRQVGGFTPVTDPQILARLPHHARAQVVQLDLRAQGITDYGHLRSRGFDRPVAPAHLEVFVDGMRLTPARWPNDGYLLIDGVPEETASTSEWGVVTGSLAHGFHYAGDRPRSWQPSDDIWVHGYWLYDWANSYEQVAAIDVERRLVLTREPHGLYGFGPGQRFYFLNILEELDAPGEYYLDCAAGLLYCWLPERVETAEVLVSLLETPLVLIRGASHVRFTDLTFACTRGDAVVIEGGEQIVVGGCAFRAIGNRGVTVEGGSAHEVSGCELSELGDAGITLAGGDRATLAPAHHVAVNNHVHRFAQWSRTYQAGIQVAGVGIRVANNCIHDGPHTGILLSGNEHLIELNELYRLCLDTGDVGAFYMGRDFTQQGIVIRHNFFHHLGGLGLGSMAVYLDDCTSGVTIFGNVFFRTQYAAFIGGGRDNTVENNIFIDCQPAVHVDGRGATTSPVWRAMVDETMLARLEAMQYRQPPYSIRYPRLLALEPFFQGTPGVPPEGNRVCRNIQWGGRWLDVQQPASLEMLEVDGNLLDIDPHFINPAGLDFGLREDSPAFALGFQPIPFRQIGLDVDAFRHSLPERELHVDDEEESISLSL